MTFTEQTEARIRSAAELRTLLARDETNAGVEAMKTYYVELCNRDNAPISHGWTYARLDFAEADYRDAIKKARCRPGIGIVRLLDSDDNCIKEQRLPETSAGITTNT